jgi:cation/acetate symporter
LVLSAVVPGTPYLVGVVVAGAGVAITLALGGMRAATYVQAFQFALKLVLFIVPAVWLLIVVGPGVRDEAVHPVEFTRFEKDTPVTFRVGVTLEVSEPTRVLIDAREELIEPGSWQVGDRTQVTFLAGGAVPELKGLPLPGGPGWQRPLLDLQHAGYPLLGTWALLVSLMLGTMGLPHVLMRFHTSPDGRSARRTAALTVGLLSLFYLFPAVYGVLGRVLVPQLYLSGATDTAVVALPAQVDAGLPGTIFTGLLTAGAFAAFLATSLGLVLVVSGAISYDLLPGGLGALRMAVFGAATAVVLLALMAIRLDAGVLVTWAFTVAASTFCPLLVLGIWWSRLTVAGAMSGVLAGLLGSAGAIVATLFGPPLHGWLAILVAQPAPWTVPLAFLTMIAVSLRGRPPAWAQTAMLRLHLNEDRPVPRRVDYERDPGHSTRSKRRSSAVRRATGRLVR